MPSFTQGLEKYLMTKIYYKTFAQSELDRERDVTLSQRMAALSFVQPHHLDIPQQYQEGDSSQLAIKELHKINNYKVCHVAGGLQSVHGKGMPGSFLLTCRLPGISLSVC